MRTMQIRQSFFLAASILAILPCSVVTADTVTGGGTWLSWTQAQLYQGAAPTPGTPYWNNLSGDGSKGNIGWCLTGGGATCTMANSPGAPMLYYGAGGASLSNMSLTSAGIPMTLTVASVITDEKLAGQYDVFGYYIVPPSGAPTLVPLFSTAPGASQAVTGSTAGLNLTAGTNYGFYIENIQGAGGAFVSGYYFYMNSASNSSTFNGSPSGVPDSDQHFAIFQNGSSYIIGDVDGYACSDPSLQGKTPCELASQFDYNDFIVTLSPTVPEPATVGLMALSLVFLGGLLRRKLRNPA